MYYQYCGDCETLVNLLVDIVVVRRVLHLCSLKTNIRTENCWERGTRSFSMLLNAILERINRKLMDGNGRKDYWPRGYISYKSFNPLKSCCPLLSSNEASIAEGMETQNTESINYQNLSQHSPTIPNLGWLDSRKKQVNTENRQTALP